MLHTYIVIVSVLVTLLKIFCLPPVQAAMEEFAKIKDEVPSAIMDAHMKNVKEAVSQKTVISFDPKVITFCILAGRERR